MKLKDVNSEINSKSEEEIMCIELLDKMYSELLEDIVTVRVKKGITQEQLGKMTGHHQSVISRFEKAERKSNIRTLLTIINALGYKVTIKPKGRK